MTDQQKITETLGNNLNIMLANLEGNLSRLHEMVDQFEVETKERDRKRNKIFLNPFPDVFPVQKQMMRAYNYMDKREMPPTRENMIRVLRDIFFLPFDGEHITQAVDNVLAQATESKEIHKVSIAVAKYLRQYEVVGITPKIIELLETPLGKLDDRLDKAIELLASIRSDNDYDDSPLRTQKELVMWYLTTVLPERVSQRKKGIQYPNLKFRDFVGTTDEDGNPNIIGKIPYLKWGQTTFVLAKTGFGKTTFAGIWAEHNAWRLGHDVLFLHLETEPDEIMDRSIARNTFVPLNYLQNVLDPKNPEDKQWPMVNRFLKWTIDPSKIPQGSGDIVYKYCPGWTVEQINQLIKLVHLRANKRGRGLVVLLDYYDIIDWSTSGTKHNRAEAKGEVAKKLRDVVKRLNLSSPIHMIMFGQENEDSSPNNPRGYGSHEVHQYVQVILSIQRNEAEFDDAKLENGVEVVDAVGNKRWWHRKGNWDSMTRLLIHKGNNHGRGEIIVRMENALYRVEDVPMEFFRTIQAQQEAETIT